MATAALIYRHVNYSLLLQRKKNITRFIKSIYLTENLKSTSCFTIGWNQKVQFNHIGRFELEHHQQKKKRLTLCRLSQWLKYKRLKKVKAQCHSRQRLCCSLFGSWEKQLVSIFPIFSLYPYLSSWLLTRRLGVKHIKVRQDTNEKASTKLKHSTNWNNAILSPLHLNRKFAFSVHLHLQWKLEKINTRKNSKE